MGLAALEQYAIAPVRVRVVFHENNTTLCVWAQDGGKYALRISRPNKMGHDVLREEVKCVDALSKTAVAAAGIVRNRRGRRITRVGAPGVPEKRDCVLFDWLRGSQLAERMTTDNCRRWGELSARLHESGRQLDLQLPVLDDVYDGVAETLFNPEHHALIKPDVQLDLRALRDSARRVLRSLKDRTVIHGDLHPWNIKIDRGHLRPIDFEYIRHAHPLQDVAISLYYLDRLTKKARDRHAFIDGYTSVAGWPERQDGQLATLIAARGLLLLNEVLATPDPHIRAFAPRVLRQTKRLIKRAQTR